MLLLINLRRSSAQYYRAGRALFIDAILHVLVLAIRILNGFLTHQVGLDIQLLVCADTAAGTVHGRLGISSLIYRHSGCAHRFRINILRSHFRDYLY